MILSKKTKRLQEEQDMKRFIEAHNSDVLSAPQTIGVQVVEGQDWINEVELGMTTATVVMMNKAEINLLISSKRKSLKKNANAVITYGKYENGIFIGRPKNFWYSTV